MAGECDTNFDNEDIKQPEKIETKTENVKDEDLLKDILINTRPKKKTSKIDPLAEVLNVSIEFHLNVLI